MMIYGGTVYIMTNIYHTVLYTGVTSNLKKRVWEHRNRAFPNCFTDRYNCVKLVWYQSFLRIEEAIGMEKKIKAGSRNDKLELIRKMNPYWKDLWREVERF